MSIQVIDDIKTYLQENLSSMYPTIVYYDHDPRGHAYERPFIGIQYRGKNPTKATSTIGNKKYEHVIDIIIGVDATDTSLAEAAMENIASSILDLFVPWSYVTANKYLVIATDYVHESERSSRLRDEGQIRIKLADT